MIWPTDILSIETWVLIITIIALARYLLHRKWQYLAKLQIPHDPPKILKMGHLLDIFKKGAFEIDVINKKRFGPIWGFYAGLDPNIVINDVDMLRQIFIKEFPSFPDRQKAKGLRISGAMNDGLTSVQGKKWKRIRASMTPTFSTAKLKQMTSVIEWCVDNTVEVLNKKIKEGDGTFDLKEVFSRLSLDIVCSAAFSTKVQSQDDSKEEPEISKKAKKLFSFSIFSPLTILAILIPPFGRFLARCNYTVFDKDALNYFENLTNYIIKQRGDQGHQRRVDLMQLLLDAEVSEEDLEKDPDKGITRKEIVANSMLMILAGYENTANTIGYVMYNLAMYPKIQEDVQAEIDEMVENHGKFDYEGVNSLKLLDMCFNESLRLYIPIIRNARYCEKEVTINGFTIPAGATVSVPTYGLAHDPEYWDEPFEFKPERMEDMTQIDPMIFQPFGAGPRNCIGMRFATMEVKMAACKLLHKFTFKPTKDTPKPPLEMALKSGGVRPKVDLTLEAVPRETSASE